MKYSRIQKYLSAIHLPFDELYGEILSCKLHPEQLRESGFPTNDPDNPEKVTLCSDFLFSSSQNPAEQICRCGKAVSLLDKDWYKDEFGCSYHLGKRIFCNGPENGLFSCCQRVYKKNGCAHHKYHVSSFRPLEGTAFVNTKFNNKRSIDSVNVFALDCEMVFTTAGMEVVKVSVVSVTGDVLYNSFVLPFSIVLDYNTAFSGVSARDLEGITTTLPDVQKSLLQLFDSDSVIIGHGLENDLVGLRLVHENIVDTSILYAHERGFPLRHSLKYLASRYLKKDIHSQDTGHNSVEDAKTSLELVLHSLYLATLIEIPFVNVDSGFNCDIYVPFVVPVVFKAFTSSCISKPLFSQNFWNYGSLPSRPCPHNGRRSNMYKHVQFATPYKFVRFETPVFPIVPRPASIYMCSSTCLGDCQELPRKTSKDADHCNN